MCPEIPVEVGTVHGAVARGVDIPGVLPVHPTAGRIELPVVFVSIGIDHRDEPELAVIHKERGLRVRTIVRQQVPHEVHDAHHPRGVAGVEESGVQHLRFGFLQIRIVRDLHSPDCAAFHCCADDLACGDEIRVEQLHRVELLSHFPVGVMPPHGAVAEAESVVRPQIPHRGGVGLLHVVLEDGERDTRGREAYEGRRWHRKFHPASGLPFCLQEIDPGILQSDEGVLIRDEGLDETGVFAGEQRQGNTKGNEMPQQASGYHAR
jgi:hypothetical protein